MKSIIVAALAGAVYAIQAEAEVEAEMYPYSSGRYDSYMARI